MVRLTKIYTRTGDDGTSGLVDGTRRSKDDKRFDVCGTLDETNALLGWARVYTKEEDSLRDVDEALGRIQNDLFDLGADLAMPSTPQDGAVPLRIVEPQVQRLELEIDHWNASLSPLKSFILPGGTRAASILHLARTVCRRLEREAVTLARHSEEYISPIALQYINRLSDFLFVAARVCNRSAGDVLWVPGRNR
jgi:cob(I)alamin adenosyltransferase